MRAIAAAAGVAVPIVELQVGTKARLVKTAIDVAIAGDDEPVPVLDRVWTAAATAASNVDEFLTGRAPAGDSAHRGCMWPHRAVGDLRRCQSG
jgi:hypothetical protein